MDLPERDEETRRVLIGRFGSIVRLGLRELIEADTACSVVAEETAAGEVMDRLADALPDVVVLDLDAGPEADALVSEITAEFPAMTVIACSSDEPRMKVFPPHQGGESYTTPLSPELLIEAVRAG